MGDVLWKMSAAGRMGPLWGVTRQGVASVTNSRRVESQGLFWDRESDRVTDCSILFLSNTWLGCVVNLTLNLW